MNSKLQYINCQFIYQGHYILFRSESPLHFQRLASNSDVVDNSVLLAYDFAARIGPFMPLGNPTIPIKQKAFRTHPKAKLIKYLVPEYKYLLPECKYIVPECKYLVPECKYLVPECQYFPGV